MQCFAQGVLDAASFHLNDGSDSVQLLSMPSTGTGYYRIKIVDDADMQVVGYSSWFQLVTAVTDTTTTETTTSRAADDSDDHADDDSADAASTAAATTSDSKWLGNQDVHLSKGVTVAIIGAVAGFLIILWASFMFFMDTFHWGVEEPVQYEGTAMSKLGASQKGGTLDPIRSTTSRTEHV